jgi:hypothetical protein
LIYTPSRVTIFEPVVWNKPEVRIEFVYAGEKMKGYGTILSKTDLR